MRFIENVELREWVKDNLKKAIFQKAHALAAQTGCEILVKMKDVNDTTPHQYYATGSLRRIYIGNALRRVPGEKTVSGETGLPLVDQSVQFGDQADVGFKDSYLGVDGGGDQLEAIPVQLSSVASGDCDNQIESQPKIKEEVMDEGDVSEMGTQSEQGIMISSSYSIADNRNTSQMTSYQATSTGFSVGSDSQKYSVPISPKPYQCGVCGKAFRTVQVLQKHTQTFHMRPGGSSSRGRGRGRGLNQFAKALAFKHQTQQALMSRQAELQSESFTCVICNQTFDRPERLSEHITNFHSDENSLSASLPGLQNSLSASLPGLPTQFDDQLSNTGSVDMSQAQPSNVQFHPSHSAPSGLDLSSGSMTFSQQQSPMIQSPFKYPHTDTGSPNKPGTSSGSPGSAQSKRKWSFQRKPEVTIRTIMSAILLSAGPISTHYAVRRYGPKYLRNPSIPKEQYLIAATALQEAKLGMLVTVKNATGLSDTFIKKSPTEILDELKHNSDLATLEEYTYRFQAPPPACITPAMQASVIQHGLLPPGSFSERKHRPQPAPSPPPSQIFDSRLQMMDSGHGLLSKHCPIILSTSSASSSYQIPDSAGGLQLKSEPPSTSAPTTSILEARLQLSDPGSMFQTSEKNTASSLSSIFQTSEKNTASSLPSQLSDAGVHVVEPASPTPSPPASEIPDASLQVGDSSGEFEPRGGELEPSQDDELQQENQ